jgi:hypothetical protein
MIRDSPIYIKNGRHTGLGHRNEEKGRDILFEHLKDLGDEKYLPSDKSNRDEFESVLE